MRMLEIALVLLLAFLMAYIRFAPTNPALWHQDPSLATSSAGGFQTSRLFQEPPTALLGRLNAIALATPRTIWLDGTVESGRITWVTRSFIMGFPDYTTAQVTQTEGGTRLDIFARLRFGGSDFGVNAARVNLWLQHL